MKKEITLQEVYKLAVKKWKLVVDFNGDDRQADIAIPEIKQFRNNCPYCELFVKVETGCKGCPLTPVNLNYGLGCRTDDHPYDLWLNHPIKRTAQAVLDLIVKTKPF
ncbi:MAG: hypothetical protein WC222_11525 [Parachlamydiales bacterium]|jgi:hypothetical protein